MERGVRWVRQVFTLSGVHHEKRARVSPKENHAEKKYAVMAAMTVGGGGGGGGGD